MAVQDYKINYKSDFVLNINGDAGWAIPFCIKFWTGMPSQAYFVGFDGVKYVNCKVGDTPTQMLVMFDDHHLPIGKLKMQIAYHTTIEEFPGSVFDEVTNARDVIVTIDGTDYQVLLDFTGEDAPELEFDLPAYANEAERIQNELQRQQNEADRIAAELQREQATAAAVQGAENVNAQLNGTTLTVTNRQGVSTSVNTKGERGEQGPVGPEGPQGEQGVSIVSFRQVYASETATYYSITFSDGHEQSVAIPKGAKGDTGATGPTGPQGPQGDTGVSITGFVETGETETATLYNITFSNGTTQQVAIPKGEKGDQGPAGPTGPQGPMGDVAVITPEQQAAFTMYSTTGQNTNGPMTQKAVTDALVAEAISYDNSQSGLAAENVQGALDEVVTNVAKKPNVVGDDSEHILNLTDANGNVLAYWNSDGEMVFKKKISLVKRWIYTIPVNSSTDDKGTYYDTNGTLQKLGANSAASYFGTTKINITAYNGKIISIKTNIGGGGYNLFVDANNNVLERWQQNGSVIQKQVPSDAQYLLLSNTFYLASRAGVCTDPDVFYVDGLEYLINMHKQWVSVVEDSSQNIFNITDENGNILAYFDANGIFHTNNIDDEFQIYIPSVINSYVGDVLQLFKYPITLLGDYSNYGVNLSVATTDNNVKKQGRDLRRYFQFTPTAVGEYNIHVNVMNTKQSRMLAESTMKINVLTPTNPSSVKNILCVGDSEVEGVVNNSGITATDGSIASTRSPWTNELKALMTTSRAATDVLPAGLGLNNIHLIGTRNTSGGRHEGYGGKSADFFLSNTSSNPFYVGGSVDFNAYLAQNSVYDDTSHKGVDIMYIMLGGNNESEVTRNGNKLIVTKPTAKTQMIALLNAINAQLRTDSSKAYYNPNLKVVLLNYYSPWIEGYGYHPYGSGRYTDNCWTALGFYVCHQINNEIAAMDEYKDWVSSVMLSTQVDSENAFVYINKQKNVYMSETEIASLEAVHPNSIGYKMLGAAVMRDLLGRI